MPRRSGFTLIELLIVVVIIGIIAAIAVPKFNSTKGKAHAAALRGDLRNLATAQETYFYTHQAYSADTSQLNYKTTNGSRLTIVNATRGGWSAIATHPLSFPLTCALFSGTVPSLPPATVEGQISCQ